MDNLMKGRTVFVIAHRLSTIRNSNAIIVLEHGKIIERGDHEDLIIINKSKPPARVHDSGRRFLLRRIPKKQYYPRMRFRSASGVEIGVS